MDSCLVCFFNADSSCAHENSGAERGADGSSRRTREEARSTCVRFSPTGREWAACTTDGLLLYSLDEAAVFDPSDLDESVTPEAVQVRCLLANMVLVGTVVVVALRWWGDERCYVFFSSVLWRGAGGHGGPARSCGPTSICVSLGGDRGVSLV